MYRALLAFSVVALSGCGPDPAALDIQTGEVPASIALFAPTGADGDRRPPPREIWRLGENSFELGGIWKDTLASRALARHVVFRGLGSRGRLEAQQLPYGGSIGLFAADTLGNATYLQHGDLDQRLAALQAVLRADGTDLSLSDPRAFSALFAAALLQDGNSAFEVISRPEDLELGPSYVIAADQLRIVRPFLREPELRRTLLGWQLTFLTLGGWMHERNQVAQHVVSIRPGFRLRLRSRSLSDAIYSQIPSIAY